MGIFSTDVTMRASRYKKNADGTITIEVEIEASSYLPWNNGITWVTYTGKPLQDGTMLWKEKSGRVVGESMERWLNRRHRHFSNQ
jgi:hypothetical protein